MPDLPLAPGLEYEFGTDNEACPHCGRLLVLMTDGDPDYPEWYGACCGVRWRITIKTAVASVETDEA